MIQLIYIKLSIVNYIIFVLELICNYKNITNKYI